MDEVLSLHKPHLERKKVCRYNGVVQDHFSIFKHIHQLSRTELFFTDLILPHFLQFVHS